MNRQEFSKVVAALKTYYPGFNLFVNDTSLDLWYDALRDIPYQVIVTTLKKWVMTNKFPPTIADIRGTAVEVVGEKSADYGEAWETVCKQIRKFGYMRHDEAMEDLRQKDEVIYRAVKYIGYQKLCESENVEADRANFRMIYEREAEKANREKSLKDDTRNDINLIQGLARRGKLDSNTQQFLESAT